MKQQKPVCYLLTAALLALALAPAHASSHREAPFVKDPTRSGI